MATKKFLSLERLQEYDELIKAKIDEGDASAKSYTDTSVSNITNGTTVVAEATHATSADSAATATTAETATNATKATQDANGNVITDTYETKTDAIAKLNEAKTYTDTVASGKADASHNHNDIYYTIEQIDAMEFITTDDIDEICGASIVAANEVTY